MDFSVESGTVKISAPARSSRKLRNLPAGGTDASPYPYAEFTAAGLTRDIAVTCTSAPVTYAFAGTRGTITPVIIVSQALATTSDVDFTSTVAVSGPALVIP